MSDSNSAPQRIRLVRVHYMPKMLEPGILYVSEEYGAAAHLCACGCGAKIRTPLGPEQWGLHETKHGPTLSPSVGNWQQECRSHYMIIRGEVRWCRAWTSRQIEAARRDEQDRMRAHCTRRAVERLLAAAAPECAAAVSSLLFKYGLIFHVASDTDGFLLEAGAFPLVRFTERSLDQLWVLGHAAWRACNTYSAYVAMDSGGRISRAQIERIEGQAEAEHAFNSAVDAADAIGRAEPDTVLPWPEGIPTRAPERTRTAEEQATFEIIMLATAYTFLHEAKHVAFAAEGDARAATDEELECDSFAREFLLDHVEEYASSSGQHVALVTGKRTIAIALGLFFIVALTPPDRRSGSETHPGLGERMRQALADGTDHTLIFFSSLLIAWLRRNGSLPDQIEYTDYDDLLRQLIAAL